LWAEVTEERQDRGLSADRQLEAMLGFDPDEVPEELLTAFKNLIPRAGKSAVREIAPVCASDHPTETLERILKASAAHGPHGKFEIEIETKPQSTAIPSWERGRELARKVRTMLALNGEPIPDSKLCDLIGLSPQIGIEARSPGSPPPLGMAIRTARETDIKFVFRRRARASRRFEIARFVCDHLIAEKSDNWLPATDEKTSRQRTQRAFAAEFLCPIDSVTDFLSGDFSSDTIEEAAEHFGVSSLAIESQLVNHHIVPNILAEYSDQFHFPYAVRGRYVAGEGPGM